MDPEDLPGQVPDMSASRAMLIAEYQWIREQTIKEGVKHKRPKDLEVANELFEEARTLAKVGIEATAGMAETH
ncbi:MAG: hypothetical protein AB7O54_13720 [Pseudomonadales bacterium]